MNLNCTCYECDQSQMEKHVAVLPWGERITWRCVETKTPHAWLEVIQE